MGESAEDILWQIVQKNMGDNSLTLFKDFYKGDPFEEQYQGALELFLFAFGRVKAKEMLQPVANVIARERG